jgi:hypothetical protein
MFLMSTLTEMITSLVPMIIAGYYGYWVSEVAQLSLEPQKFAHPLLLITGTQGVHDWGSSKATGRVQAKHVLS